MAPELQAGGPPSRVQDLRVLVVEDEYLVAERIKEIVESTGAEVLGPVPTLAGALDYVAGEAIDVALVDMYLRDNFADELIEQLVARDIPYVIVSGIMHMPNNHELLAAGRIDKPVVASEIVDLLHKIAAAR